MAAGGQPTPAPLSTAPQPAQPCCESGRPVLTDPLTGQTVCSCQYDAQLFSSYQRLAGLPLYGSAALAGELGAEQSAFYSPAANGFDLKESLEAWRNLPYASVYYPYEGAALAGYPFPNGYAVDLNGARRKNATRETTSTLKAWLNEHRKNPYPTKGEKIMLAIITKMTLTQVSTWFANARRRLKKENKMTWSPRNRCDDDDDDLRAKDDDNRSSDGGGGDRRAEEDLEDRIHPTSRPPHGLRGSLPGKLDFSDEEGGSSKPAPVLHPEKHRNGSSGLLSPGSPVSSLASDSESSPAPMDPTPNKPRIWSIVDTATSNTSSSRSRVHHFAPYPKPPSTWYPLGGTGAPSGPPFPLYPPLSGAPSISESSLGRLRSLADITAAATTPKSLGLTSPSSSSSPRQQGGSSTDS